MSWKALEENRKNFNLQSKWQVFDLQKVVRAKVSIFGLQGIMIYFPKVEKLDSRTRGFVHLALVMKIARDVHQSS